MIVRMSEAVARPGREAELREMIVAAVVAYPARYDGLLGHEVLSSDGGRYLVYASRWRDEEALAEFAGAGWRDQPVQLAGEQELLEQPLRVRHYEVVLADGAGSA